MIRTLRSEQDSSRSISLVEIIDRDRSSRTAWEFACDLCGDLSSGLSEAEARAELVEHECPNAFCSDRSEAGDACGSCEGCQAEGRRIAKIVGDAANAEAKRLRQEAALRIPDDPFAGLPGASR